MVTKQLILIVQIIISCLLIAMILIQSKGAGLGGGWMGGGGFYSSKRGVEKIVFVGTIILGAAFLLISIANILIG